MHCLTVKFNQEHNLYDRNKISSAVNKKTLPIMLDQSIQLTSIRN